METSNVTLRRLKTFLKSLENKFALKNHSHATSDITGLNTALSSKATSVQGSKADTAVQSVKIGTTEYKSGTTVTLPSYPTSLPASDVPAWAKASTKPSYTKSEVGLSNVDNTADVNKSVKYATSADSATNATNSTNLRKNSSFNDLALGQVSYYDAEISNTTNNASWSAPSKGWYQIYHNDLSVGSYWTELAFPVNDVNGLAWRQRRSGDYYGWYRILDSNNYGNYTVGKTGNGASGTWKINITGSVNGHTINSDVPSGAKFTDTTYNDATTSVHGLMSPADKTKLDKIGSNVSIGSQITIASGTSISGVANNLTTTGANFVLDARQGKALNDSITSLKKSASDGKSAIASAITNAGVSTASDASFAIMVENIGNIFYKRLGKQLSKYYYANIFATSGSNGSQNIYRNIGTTTTGNWIGHETFFGGVLTDLNGCIIITWLRGINAITIMRHKSAWLGTDNFETLYDLNLRYSHPDGGTITLHSSAITPGVEICTLCLACHS